MDIIQLLTKKTLHPFSRAYIRYILGDKPADSFLAFLCKIDFWSIHKYWPNFRKPQSISEKIYCRMLFDRNPLLTLISDKLCVRNYVANIIGNEYMIPVLWHGGNPDEIPFENLPSKFVIKANHGCGYNIIIKNKKSIHKAETIKKLKTWLNENFCTDKYIGIGWAYKNIKPKIMVETFIGNNGIIPEDYKFFCFSERTEFVLISFDRFGLHKEKHFNRQFIPFDLWNGASQQKEKIRKPINYDKMLELADKISKNFDFVRVDLYNVNGKIYFGELTPYPGGGRARFIPKRYDYLFGKNWNFSEKIHW